MVKTNLISLKSENRFTASLPRAETFYKRCLPRIRSCHTIATFSFAVNLRRFSIEPVMVIRVTDRSNLKQECVSNSTGRVCRCLESHLRSLCGVLRRRHLPSCPSSCINLSSLATHFVGVSHRASHIMFSTSYPASYGCYVGATDVLRSAGPAPTVHFRRRFFRHR